MFLKSALLGLGFCLAFTGFAGAQSTRSWCAIQGGVFVEKEATRAQYRVFVEDSESFADLLVFKAPNLLFADKPGLWFMATSPAQAEVRIFFVKERNQADFSIFYIDNESFAGCNSSR